MPVDIFGFYTLLEPYIITYYDVGKPDKARQLFFDTAKKYQENLTYFSGLSIKNQERLFEEIYIDIERYRGLVDALVLNDKDSEFVEQQMKTFNEYLRKFSHFIGPEDIEETPRDADIFSDSSEIEALDPEE